MTIILFIIALALLPYAFIVGFYILMYSVVILNIIFESVIYFLNKHNKISSFLGKTLLYVIFFSVFIPVLAFFDK